MSGRADVMQTKQKNVFGKPDNIVRTNSVSTVFQ